MPTDPLDRALDRATEEVDPAFAAALRARLIRQLDPIFEGDTTMTPQLTDTPVPTVATDGPITATAQALNPTDPTVRSSAETSYDSIGTVVPFQRRRPRRIATISAALISVAAVSGIAYIAVNRPADTDGPVATDPVQPALTTQPQLGVTVPRPPDTTPVPELTAPVVSPDEAAVEGFFTEFPATVPGLDGVQGEQLPIPPGGSEAVAADGSMFSWSQPDQLVLLGADLVPDLVAVTPDPAWRPREVRVGPDRVAYMIETDASKDEMYGTPRAARLVAVPTTGDRRGERIVLIDEATDCAWSCQVEFTTDAAGVDHVGIAVFATRQSVTGEEVIGNMRVDGPAAVRLIDATGAELANPSLTSVESVIHSRVPFQKTSDGLLCNTCYYGHEVTRTVTSRQPDGTTRSWTFSYAGTSEEDAFVNDLLVGRPDGSVIGLIEVLVMQDGQVLHPMEVTNGILPMADRVSVAVQFKLDGTVEVQGWAQNWIPTADGNGLQLFTDGGAGNWSPFTFTFGR